MIVNGNEVNFDDNITVSQLLSKLDINPDTVVVEVNLEIVSKDNYSDYILNKEDKIEIINLVGGG